MFDSKSLHDHLSDEILNEYLDARITPEQQKGIENHLLACHNCAKRYHALQWLVMDLTELPELEPTHDLREFVLRAIRPPVVLPRLWRWAVVLQISLAGLLFFVSLPVLLDSEMLQNLDIFGAQWDGLQFGFADLFKETLDFLAQPSRLLYAAFSAFQQTDLPFSFITLLPILLVAALLWVVGNGLLLRNQISATNNGVKP